MRPLGRVRPNIDLAQCNSVEKIGAFALPVDLIATKVNRFQLRLRAANIKRVHDEKQTELGLVVPEIKSGKEEHSELTGMFRSYGKALVRLTDTEEHYTRYRHFEGSLLDRRTQRQHRFLVALRETSALANEIGIDVQEQQTSSALEQAAREFEQTDLSRQDASAAVTALALQNLAEATSHPTEEGT